MDGETFIKQAYDAILANDFEQAIACFAMAIAFEPDNASFHYRLSVTCARSDRLRQALNAAENACRLDPGNESYRSHLDQLKARELVIEAQSCFDDGPAGLKKAAQLLERAVALDPLLSEAYLLLGLARGECKQYNEAVRALQELVRLEPHHMEGKKLLRKYRRKGMEAGGHAPR